MHEHDDELIAAVAEGSLPPAEVERAQDVIAACRECRAALAAQRTALEAMAAAPEPGLSALESARLRKAIAEKVGIGDAPAKERRFVPWAGVATAAAVLVAIVIAAPLVNLLSTGDDDAADGSAAPAAAETTVPSRQEAEALEDDAVDAAAPTDNATDELSAATQGADGAAEEGLAEAPGPELEALPALGPVTVEDLEALRDSFLEQAGTSDGLELRDVTLDEAGFLEFSNVPPPATTQESASAQDCTTAISSAVAGASLIISTATAEFDGVPVLVVAAFTAEVGPPTIALIDVSTCDVVATVGS